MRHMLAGGRKAGGAGAEQEGHFQRAGGPYERGASGARIGPEEVELAGQKIKELAKWAGS